MFHSFSVLITMVKRKSERKKKNKPVGKKTTSKKRTKKKNTNKKRTKNKTQHNRNKNRKGNYYNIRVMVLKEEGYNIWDINVADENQYSLITKPPVEFFMYDNENRETHLLNAHVVTGDKSKCSQFEGNLCYNLYITSDDTHTNTDNYVRVEEPGPDKKITERLEDVIRIFRIVKQYIQNSKEFELNTNHVDMYNLVQRFRAVHGIKSTPKDKVEKKKEPKKNTIYSPYRFTQLNQQLQQLRAEYGIKKTPKDKAEKDSDDKETSVYNVN